MEPTLSPLYHVKNSQPLAFDRFSLKLEWEDCDESETCLRRILADIMGHREGADPTKLGNVKARIVRVSRALKRGADLWSIMDEESDSLSCIYRAFYGPGRTHAWPYDSSPSNIFRVSDILLEPDYRGYGLGLLVVHSMISALPTLNTTMDSEIEIDLPFRYVEVAGEDDDELAPPDVDVVLIVPGGINGEDLRSPGMDPSQSVKKLTDHWGKLGFSVAGRQLGNIPVLLGFQTIYMQPRIETIVPHLIN